MSRIQDRSIEAAGANTRAYAEIEKAQCPKSSSSLVRRLVLAENDPAKRRIRERLACPGANRNPSLKEWERILASSGPEEILAILVEDSEAGARLRQSSPFVGVLSREERNAIFALYETL